MTTLTDTKLYELINPSDPYTFRAPSIEVAGAAVLQLSSNFGARCVEPNQERRSTPVIFGWDEWLDEHGIDRTWIEAHITEIADALDSFLIGGANDRADVESMLAMLPEEKRQEWRDQRQDRHRSSLNQIGEHAYALARQLRERSDA